jgi:hypothetical protein
MSYKHVETFELPVKMAVFDALADGRLVLAGENQIWFEMAAGSRAFEVVSSGEVGNADFVRVSPSGTRVAVGNFEK